jgi:hypothetical protein
MMGGDRNVINFDTTTGTFTVDTNKYTAPNPLDAGTWSGISVWPLTPTAGDAINNADQILDVTITIVAKCMGDYISVTSSGQADLT